MSIYATGFLFLIFSYAMVLAWSVSDCICVCYLHMSWGLFILSIYFWLHGFLSFMYCHQSTYQFTESLGCLQCICLSHLFSKVLFGWDGGWLHMSLCSQDNTYHLCNPNLVASAIVIIIPVANYGPMYPWVTTFSLYCWSWYCVENWDIFTSLLYLISIWLSSYEHIIMIIILIEHHRCPAKFWEYASCWSVE